MSTELGRGSPSYRAPELIAEVSTFSNRADIWGLGRILFELAVKRKAFMDDWAVREYTVSKPKLDVPLEAIVEGDILTLLTNLIREMLRINPRARPDAQDLKELFNILVDNKPITALNSDNPLHSKIYRHLSEDDESDINRNAVYVRRPLHF